MKNTPITNQHDVGGDLAVPKPRRKRRIAQKKSPYDNRSKSFRQWKFGAMMIILGLFWLSIPFCCPNKVAEWFDNQVIPNAGYWGLILSAVSIMLRKKLLKEGEPQSHPLLIVIGAILFLFPWIWKIGFAPVSHYLFLAASGILVFGVGGIVWLRVIVPALMVMALLPVFPSEFGEIVINKLQQVGVWTTYNYCHLFLSEDYLRHGHMIFLPVLNDLPELGVQVRIVVSKECSGFRSLSGMIIWSILLAADLGLVFRRKLLVIVVAIFMAVGGNILRLILSATFLHFGLKFLSNNPSHSFLGYVVMAGEFSLLYLLSKKLRSDSLDRSCLWRATTS